MKHLRVLEDAGLVVTRRSGREKLHFLNPVPIRLIHDRWIDKYTERRVSALADLKQNWRRPHDHDDKRLTTQMYRVSSADPRRCGRRSRSRVHGAVLPRRRIESSLVPGEAIPRVSTDEEPEWVDGGCSSPTRRDASSSAARALRRGNRREEPSRVTWEIDAGGRHSTC